MEQRSFLDNATLPAQKCLLFMILSLELAACHLLASGFLYLEAAGMSGIYLLLPMLAIFGTFMFVIASNIASVIIGVRLLYFEKDDNSWGPFAKVTIPATTVQTGVLLIIFLLYPMTVQFIVGCIGLMMGGIFFLLLRHYAKAA